MLSTLPHSSPHLCLINQSRVPLHRASLLAAGSLCVDGYFEQFGVCVQCPTTSGTSGLAVFGIFVVLAVACFALYRVRTLLPVDVLKLGVSMLQVS